MRYTLRPAIAATAALCLLLICNRVRGSLKIVDFSNPAGDPIREVVRIFLAKISASDADGAKALFDGPPQQADLLDAHLRLIVASNALQKTLVSRFGDTAAVKGLSVAEGFSARSKRTGNLLLAVDGDNAAVSGGSLLDPGLLLHRGLAGWKIHCLTNHPSETKIFGQYVLDYASVLDSIRAKVEADKALSFDQLLSDKEITDEFLRAEAAYSKAVDAPGPLESAPPSTGGSDVTLGPTTAPISVIGVDDLRPLLGLKFGSEEVQRTIQTYQSLPSIAVAEKRLIVNNDAPGIGMVFDLPSATLSSAAIFVEPSYGFMAYTGSLPYGLHRGDTRRVVERKLGAPQLCSGWRLGCSADYPNLGLSISYNGTSARDPMAVIARLKVEKIDGAFVPAEAHPDASGHRLTIRLVVDRGVDGDPLIEFLPYPDEPNATHTLAVLRHAVIDETGIAEVSASESPQEPSRWILTLGMTQEGASEFRKFTSSNIGSRLAIILDGRVLTAPVISGEMPTNIVVNFGKLIDVGTVDRFDGRLGAIVNALPSEAAPATSP